MNQQREVIYRQRREALFGDDLEEVVEDMIRELAAGIAESYADERAHPEDWDFQGATETVFKQFNFRLELPQEDTLDALTAESFGDYIAEAARKAYVERENQIGSNDMRALERIVMLQTVDALWKDHLLSMDHLKEGIGLRGYAQQNPLIIYKKEGFELFQDLISRIREETIGRLFRIQIVAPNSLEDMRSPQEQNLHYSGPEERPKKKPVRRSQKKIGRNSPCPCGSGKKFKHCCGR